MLETRKFRAWWSALGEVWVGSTPMIRHRVITNKDTVKQHYRTQSQM